MVGDKWSLLIIRDMMFGNRRHFRELLTKSEEGISSNILADRLKTLLEQGIITRERRSQPQAEGIYSLTEQGIELLPILAQMSGWGLQISPGQRGTRHPRQAVERRRPENVGGVHGRIAREPSRREATQEGGAERGRAAAGGV